MPHSCFLVRTALLDPKRKVNPFEYFSGENKNRLRKFIVYCRAGGFKIV